jgi:hypothetical protein
MQRGGIEDAVTYPVYQPKGLRIIAKIVSYVFHPLFIPVYVSAYLIYIHPYLFASSFSNVGNSNKSSLGFMVTDETYRGSAGLSLRFNGMEAGINNHVRSRHIVFHGSKFVNEHVMQSRGTIGKSLGCPAVPLEVRNEIIDVIKGGSCFYVYNPAPWYTKTSRILNAKLDFSTSGLATTIQHTSLQNLLNNSEK